MQKLVIPIAVLVLSAAVWGIIVFILWGDGVAQSELATFPRRRSGEQPAAVQAEPPVIDLIPLDVGPLVTEAILPDEEGALVLHVPEAPIPLGGGDDSPDSADDGPHSGDDGPHSAD